MANQQNTLSTQSTDLHLYSFVNQQIISICEQRLADALAHSVDPYQAAQELATCAVDCASYYSTCQSAFPYEGSSRVESEQLLLVLSIGLLAGRDPYGEKVKAVLIQSYAKIQFSRFRHNMIEFIIACCSRKFSPLVSGADIRKINHFFGCRLVAKSGSTSPINCTQISQATHDFLVSKNDVWTTKTIAQYALKEFFPEHFITP